MPIGYSPEPAAKDISTTLFDLFRLQRTGDAPPTRQPAPVPSTDSGSAPLPKRPGTRDGRIDFFRGLCLIDMLLVHFVYIGVQFGPFLQQVFGEYLRFAAGGFVGIAGLGVGAFYLPKMNSVAGRRRAAISLWRRSALIAVAYYAGTLGVETFGRLVLGSPGNERAGSFLLGTLFMQRGDDLLPLYVLLFAAAPFMLAVLRLRRGPFLLAVGSALVFRLGMIHPDLITIHLADLPLTSEAHPVFYPLLWQSIFVAGLLVGAGLRRYDALRVETRAWLGLAAWAVYGLLFASDYGPGLHWLSPHLGLTFHKVPLSLGELLRYFSLVSGMLILVDLAWPVISHGCVADILQELGRHSLPVYVMHNFLVATVSAICSWAWWLGRWQMLMFVVPSTTILWALARYLDHRRAPTTAGATTKPADPHPSAAQRCSAIWISLTDLKACSEPPQAG